MSEQIGHLISKDQGQRSSQHVRCKLRFRRRFLFPDDNKQLVDLLNCIRIYDTRILQQRTGGEERELIICLRQSVCHSQAVKRGGILSYDNGLKYSDHQAFFIDLSETDFSDNLGQDPTTAKRRGLRSRNKLHVQ